MTALHLVDRRVETSAADEALDRLARAVCVVSTNSGGTLHAATVDSFTFVSAGPPLVMVSLTKGSTMLELIVGGGSFAVSVLSEDQEWLARRFASRQRGLGAAQFDTVAYSLGSWTNAPQLHGALAWFECDLHSQVEAGDHVMVIGSLVAASTGSGNPDPLLRQDRLYRRLLRGVSPVA